MSQNSDVLQELSGFQNREQSGTAKSDRVAYNDLKFWQSFDGIEKK